MKKFLLIKWLLIAPMVWLNPHPAYHPPPKLYDTLVGCSVYVGECPTCDDDARLKIVGRSLAEGKGSLNVACFNGAWLRLSQTWDTSK